MASHNYNNSSNDNQRRPGNYDTTRGTTPNDWYGTNTPPRHSNNNSSSKSVGSNSSRDPPLSNEKQNDYYRQRFGRNSSNENSRNGPPKSSLVRFSEQLEVYSKHISQGCNTPTIPILRSKSSGSASKTKSTPNNERQKTRSPYKNPPSAGSRDPTPRASIGSANDTHGSSSRKEPAGMTNWGGGWPAMPSSVLGKPMSDPPVDRSRRLLISPAGVTRPSRVRSAEPRQVHQGALSLLSNSDRTGSWPKQANTSARKNSDMELNPRRLSSEFSNMRGTNRTTVPLRQDLAPTPTNRTGELAPTPNNEAKRSDWVLGSTVASTGGSSKRAPKKATSPKTWNMASLFANPCQSPFTNPFKATAHPPIPSIEPLRAQNRASTMPALLNITRPEQAFSSGGDNAVPTPIRERTNRRTERWREEDEAKPDNEDDLHSPSSAESASAFLIANHSKKTKQQWERGPILEGDEASGVSSGDEESTLFSEATPPSIRDRLESRDDRPAPYSDSKLYEKSSRRRKVRKMPVNHYRSYLQLGDEGSLQQHSVGTEIMALPKSIEVRVEDTIWGRQELNKGSEKTHDCMGGVLQRFRTKKVPFQELNGDVFSYDESFDLDLQEDESIIKKATSETEESDSGIHLAGHVSSWDRFERDNASDCEDDEILISSSFKNSKKRRRKRTWIIWVLVCSVIICLAGGLPIYFYFTKQQGHPDSVSASQAPTQAPQLTQIPFSGQMDYDTCVSLHGDQASDYSKRYFAIRQLLRLMSVGRTALIDEPKSAQRKALCWLSESDGYKIDISEGNEFAIIQRYSLAVLYHSLVKEDDDFTDSLVNTDFLSEAPECEWDVIMCSKPGVVSALLLSDKNLSGNLPPEVGNLEGLSKFFFGKRK